MFTMSDRTRETGKRNANRADKQKCRLLPEAAEQILFRFCLIPVVLFIPVESSYLLHLIGGQLEAEQVEVFLDMFRGA